MEDKKELMRAVFCEFIATLIFVFIGVGSVCATVEAQSSAVINYSTAFGLAITILAFSIGDVSGGHINPAVTLSMAITKQITPLRAAAYVLAQIVGAIIGAGILRGCVGKDKYFGGIGLAVEEAGGFGLEFMGTFALIFVVFNVALWSAQNVQADNIPGSVVAGLSPIPIGFAVLCAHLVLGPMTGCGINPARAIGSSVWESAAFWESPAGKGFWIYIVGPFFASLVAPWTYYSMYGGHFSTPGGLDEKGAKVEPAPAEAVATDATPAAAAEAAAPEV